MASSAEQHKTDTPSQLGKGKEVVWRWTGKLHYYTGLFLLFFVWLFGLTGLLLNHPEWRFAEFWNNRVQTGEERSIVPPAGGDDLGKARNLMRQLGIHGEIEWITTRSDDRSFVFRVSRPGTICEIRADLTEKKAAIQHTSLNSWGVMRILHTFTGVRMDDSRNRRDWVLTVIWVVAMDAVAVGLILMVLTSYYLWCGNRQKRLSGGLALATGSLLCGGFCLGLRWIF